MHFAIGGLASYRKRVFYGSALKVREYFARGFPVIMASIDEDIEQDPEARRYRIYVPNDRSLIDFKALSKDIAAILSAPDRGEIIGGIARRIFAYENKMSQLSELLKQYHSTHDK